MTPRTIKTNELQLGDVVAQNPVTQPWGSTLVVRVTDDAVHLFRPYGVTADFSYTGGVIPYIGVETYEVERSSFTEWTLYERKELK